MRRRPQTVVTISALPGLKGKSLVAGALAALLREYAQAEVLLVRARPASTMAHHGQAPLALSEADRMPADQIRSAIHDQRGQGATLDVVVGTESLQDVARGFDVVVAKLEAAFPFVVIDLGNRPASLAECVREVADVSVEIVDHADPGEDPSARRSPRVYRVMNLANPASKPIRR